MKRFIEEEDRTQITLLPACLEDYVAEDNPVRVVEVFGSLGRPGGNVTGTASLTTEITSKSFELLRELTPSAIRFAYLGDTTNEGSMLSFRYLEKNARAMNVTIQMLDGRKRSELERSFETIRRDRTQGLIVGAAGVLLEHRDQIVRFAARERLPAVYGRREHVDSGGLLSYSADIQSMFLRGADYVHRILQGTKPADLPVEQSSNVRMVLNLKTASALGIAIPPSVRLRVNEVIE